MKPLVPYLLSVMLLLPAGAGFLASCGSRGGDEGTPRAADEPPPATSAGIRGQMQGVEYVHAEPGSDRRFLVRAARMEVRDGTVGGIFRTPLLRKTVLRQLEAELWDGETNLLRLRAGSGEYVESTGVLQVMGDHECHVGRYTVLSRTVTVTPAGELRLAGDYVLRWDGGELKGRGFRGDVAALLVLPQP